MLLILFYFFLFVGALPFISPEPKLPYIFENQKLNSARNSYALGHPIKSFSLLSTEMPNCFYFGF